MNLCLLCYKVIENNEAITILECEHQYHTKCALKWFETLDFCPECNFKCKGLVNLSEKCIKHPDILKIIHLQQVIVETPWLYWDFMSDNASDFEKKYVWGRMSVQEQKLMQQKWLASLQVDLLEKFTDDGENSSSVENNETINYNITRSKVLYLIFIFIVYLFRRYWIV